METIKQLEIYRLENKISQKELAKKLGVHYMTVGKWFNKKNVPSKIQQYHIEKFLKENKVTNDNPQRPTQTP